MPLGVHGAMGDEDFIGASGDAGVFGAIYIGEP